jgi:hypothetical protein
LPGKPAMIVFSFRPKKFDVAIFLSLLMPFDHQRDRHRLGILPVKA